MPEMTVGKIEQLTLEQKAQMLADGMKGIPIDAAIRISKVFDQIAFDRDIELTILRSRVAELEGLLREVYRLLPSHPMTATNRITAALDRKEKGQTP